MMDEFAEVDNAELDIDGRLRKGTAGLDIDGRLWAIDYNILTQ